MSTQNDFILSLDTVSMNDVSRVGGKNASLGEMIQNLSAQGINVPSGFVVTAEAYRFFMKETGLDVFIKKTLSGLDTHNLKDLARRGKTIRTTILKQEMPDALAKEIRNAYVLLEKRYGKNADVAVRSSATAEDLPGASFAGEHETYLGIRGGDEVIEGVRAAMASLFTDRAISYRVDKGFSEMDIALSVGVQKMVRSDSGASGVMFTVDTESGFRDVVVINAAWGLGEMVVQGKVTPDEYVVYKKTMGDGHMPIVQKTRGEKAVKMIYGAGKRGGIKQTKEVATNAGEREKFVLTEEEILKLASWGVAIESHYSARSGKWTPMDTEWAKDGVTGELFIVQARPETVQAGRDFTKITEYKRLEEGTPLVKGMSVGSKIATGRARVILDPKQSRQFQKGEVLVTDMTDPDWEPIMKIASAIVTDKGGRTSHAAIVSRELGIPAIVGAGNATRKIKTGMEVTVDTTGTDGLVFKGRVKFTVREHNTTTIPQPKTKIMVNMASPDHAFESSFLPVAGVGLAREEFIAAAIGVHPLALIHYAKMPAPIKKAIDSKTKGWKNKTEYFVDNLAYGIGTIAAAFYPRPVIVRFSDFKTNEYRTLLGGDQFEPQEENPMIGWRGASRYSDARFAPAFALECQAIAKVRNVMGLTNLIPMVPFCRTTTEGEQTLNIMAKEGLVAGSIIARDHMTNVTAVPVYMMCEIPSNVLLADKFLDLFDGFSIGSNDLTQLTLGLDRDAGALSYIGNENNDAVRSLIRTVVERCRTRGKYIGICGQGPSDLPDFAQFLVEIGIESMSLNPDVVVKTMTDVYKTERFIASKKG